MTARTLINPDALANHLDVAAGYYENAAASLAKAATLREASAATAASYSRKAADARRMAHAFRSAGSLGWDGDSIEIC
jgi:hypothetical protein